MVLIKGFGYDYTELISTSKVLYLLGHNNKWQLFDLYAANHLNLLVSSVFTRSTVPTNQYPLISIGRRSQYIL